MSMFLWAMVGYFGVQAFASLVVIGVKERSTGWLTFRAALLVCEVLVIVWAVSLLRSMP